MRWNWFFSSNVESDIMNLLPGSFIRVERTCTSRMLGYYTTKSISVSLLNDHVWFNIVKRDEWNEYAKQNTDEHNQSNNNSKDIDQTNIDINNFKGLREYFTNYTGKYYLPKNEKIFISPAEHVCLYVEPKAAKKFVTEKQNENKTIKQFVNGFYVDFGIECEKDVVFMMENNTFIKIIIQDEFTFNAISFVENGEEDIVYECTITSQDIADCFRHQNEIIILPVQLKGDGINIVLPDPDITSRFLCKTLKPIHTAVEKTYVMDERYLKDINEYYSALEGIEMPNINLLLLLETEDITDKNKKILFYTKDEENTNQNEDELIETTLLKEKEDELIETSTLKENATNSTNNERTVILIDKPKCDDKKESEIKQTEENINTDNGLINKTQTSSGDTKSNAKDASEDNPEETPPFSMFWVYLILLCTLGGILIIIFLTLCYAMYVSKKRNKEVITV